MAAARFVDTTDRREVVVQTPLAVLATAVPVAAATVLWLATPLWAAWSLLSH
jgi:hypothetical protein